jgi:hypothetical protein
MRTCRPLHPHRVRIEGSRASDRSMSLHPAPRRHVVLVDLFWTRDKDPRVPLGHASLLTALRRNPDLDVRSIVVAVNDPGTTVESVTAWILAEVGDSPPADVDVAIGAYVWNEAFLKVLLPCLRAAGFGGRIVLGGPQISYASEGLESLYPEVDAFVRGYGEESLVLLATQGDRGPIDGVHYAGEPDQRALSRADLEQLPSPWLAGTLKLEQGQFVRWETQRGCPFRCSFCQHREPGARLRRRSLLLSRTMQEIDLFCRSRVGEIAVLDPVFNMGPNAIPVLERFAAGGFTGRLSLQCRAELLSGEFLSAAAALDTCVELGLQTIHDFEAEAISRRNDTQKVDRALADLRRLGVDHEVSLIFGLPGQTVATFIESVRWCLERHVPRIRAFPLLLLRGTALDMRRERWGLVTDGRDMPMVVRSSTFSEAEWSQMARISEALRSTEGKHPQRISELLELGEMLTLQRDRWQAQVSGVAA